MTDSNTDTNGLINPVRPRRMDHSTLPRAGSNHMGKIRREIVNCFNDTAVSGRHMEDFFKLIMAVAKETKAYIAESEQYKLDKVELAVQLKAHKNTLNKAIKVAQNLTEEASPLVTVFTFTEKAALDKWAETQGVELDGRNDLEFMQTAFVEKYTALQAVTTKGA